MLLQRSGDHRETALQGEVDRRRRMFFQEPGALEPLCLRSDEMGGMGVMR